MRQGAARRSGRRARRPAPGWRRGPGAPARAAGGAWPGSTGCRCDDRAVVGALGAAVVRVQVLDELGAGGAQRQRPGAGVAVGVAGVGEHVAERDPGGGHRGQDRATSARTGSCRHDDTVARRANSGTAGPFSLGHHDPGGEVVAVEQLVFAAQQVVLAVPPGRFGVGAGPAPGGRGPGEGLQVGPVHGQRPAGVLELVRDGCLQQVIAGALQLTGGQPVRFVLAGGVRDEAEGVLGLPAGQQVRPVLPVRDDAQPPLVVFGQAARAWCTRVRWAGR